MCTIHAARLQRYGDIACGRQQRRSRSCCARGGINGEGARMYQSMKIAILLVMLASSAVASASSCAQRAQLAKALAQQRDTGVTFEQQIKSFDQVGLSDNDKAAAYQFSMAVYKDFPNKIGRASCRERGCEYV